MKAIIHNQKFFNLVKFGRVIEAFRDIEDGDLWKQIYFILCDMFLALKSLQLCDTNYPGMDKIYYYVRSTQASIAKSVTLLNDKNFFPLIAHDNIETLAFKEEEVFGCNDNSIRMIKLLVFAVSSSFIIFS